MREKYAKKHGKLTRTIPVIIDEEMEQKIKAAKENGFNFQAWARDVFMDNFETVLEFSNSSKVKHA